MNVVIDTSIWIEFFKGNEVVRDDILKLQEEDAVLAVDIVFAELLQGALNNREIKLINSYFELMPKPNTVGLIIKAGEYAQKHKLFNYGIGLIDAIIIVTCIENDSLLWTLDKKILNYLHQQSIPYFRPTES